MSSSTSSKSLHPRIMREQRTIRRMVNIYCRGHHGRKDTPLCTECQELLDYALIRLESCRYAHLKPTCGNCPVHCYKPSMKERVMRVMAYSGPRMSYRHPWDAVMHFFDSFRPVPEHPVTRRKSSGPHKSSDT